MGAGRHWAGCSEVKGRQERDCTGTCSCRMNPVSGFSCCSRGTSRCPPKDRRRAEDSQQQNEPTQRKNRVDPRSLDIPMGNQIKGEVRHNPQQKRRGGSQTEGSQHPSHRRMGYCRHPVQPRGTILGRAPSPLPRRRRARSDFRSARSIPRLLGGNLFTSHCQIRS